MTANLQPSTLRQLRVAEIPRAVEVSEAALLGEDPFHHYLRDTPDVSESSYMSKWRLDFASYLGDRVHKGHVWTVGDEVDAFVAYNPPNQVDSDKFMESFMAALDKVTQHMFSSDQQKRRGEFRLKQKKMVQETLGERVHEMMYLGTLATDPPKQGHGFGTALVRHVTAQADAERRATWLISSNAVNNGFYNYLGFITKGQATFGEDDPTWDKPPVIVSLMVREPSQL